MEQGGRGILECHALPLEQGCLLICKRLRLSEGKVLEQLGQLNAELSAMQRELVKDWKLLDKLNRELGEARDAADAANRAKSDFLANMSHEIRTPMSGMIGLTQLLGYTELSEEQQEYVEEIQTASDTLLAIINDILDLSKIEADKLELELDDFSLHTCIKAAVASQRSKILEKGLNVDTKVVPELPMIVCGDQLRVKQILINLVSNAVKFTDAGQIGIKTTLLEKHDNHVFVQITVSDSGIGISPAGLGRIFDPFAQADASTTRRFGGTGLGLSICRQLAALMGGRIWAESEEGRGSRFHLELPFTLSHWTAEAAPGRKMPEKTAPTDLPLTILLVEDDPLSQRTAALLLKKAGHQVTCANNGKVAVEIWQQGGIDLILMDSQMPIMNGVEALQAIRAEERVTGTHVPILALTADVLKGAAERFLDIGFDGYLAKPFKLEQLLEMLKQKGYRKEGQRENTDS
jgi:signal transduction histidine kinase/ActR/RegA family two-component response regulator